MKLSKAISLRVKTLRETAGLSQQEVAMRADLSLSLVCKIEQGKKADPRASTLLALAGALEVKPGALLDDLFPPRPSPATEPPAPAEVERAEPTELGLASEPGTSPDRSGGNGKTKGKKEKGKKEKGKGKAKRG